MLPLLLLLLSCADKGADSGLPPSGSSDGGTTTTEDGGTALPAELDLSVTVLLDGAPVEGATVAQGGNPARWTTDSAGQVTVRFDTTVPGDRVLMAAHPEARIAGDLVDSALEEVARGGEGLVELALSRFATGDNVLYLFQDPGEPERRDTTGQCAHCHLTISEDWFASAHRTAASNPVVHDLYAGTAAAFADAESCAAAGGSWWTGLEPGTGASAERCYLGAGALPDLNEGCGDTGPCDGVAEQTGQCADCHAPGIDGELGGRDLLEATGHAYTYGIHCDVCHKIEEVVIADPDPGVAGRLRVLRPSEPAEIAGVGDYAPLTFGPYDDVLNPRMGSVAREDFAGPELCAGCHQHDQAVLVPGATIDLSRWPEGRLPVHSTFAEWLAGPFSGDEGGGAPCQSCHMPADGDVGNAADLGNVLEVEPGIAAGWWREPGAVRRHAWFGPRSAEQRMLDLAALVRLEGEVSEGVDGDQVEVRATVQNVGPGHALPTGEPLRHLVLVVQATCGGEVVEAVGGDAIDDLGGYRDRKEAGEDWTSWPGAEVGQRIRVVARTGAWRDYAGFGPFGDGRFDAAGKGLPEEVVVGGATIVGVDGDRVVLDGELPEGDLAWRVDGAALPVDGGTPATWAGGAGFTFARVLAGADGARMVPHHAAVDVVRDNRLLPQQDWTSTHRFPACATGLSVDAALVYRAWPVDLAAQRGWELVDQVMASASLELP